MIKKFGLPILTLFGVGYFKYAPGTAASFITCLIYFTLTESTFSLGINKIYIVVFLIFVLPLNSSIRAIWMPNSDSPRRDLHFGMVKSPKR